MFRIAFRASYQKLLFFFSLGFGLLYACIYFDLKNTTFTEGMLERLYTGCNTDTPIFSYIFLFIPIMVLCSICANFFCEDFDIVANYLLPRTKWVAKWYLFKHCSLLIQSMEAVALYFIGTAAIQCTVSHVPLPKAEEFPFLCVIFLLYSLFVYCCVAFVSVLSLAISSKWSVLLYVVALAASAVTVKAAATRQVFTIFHPFYHFFPTWHPLPARYAHLMAMPAPTSSFGFSFLYFGLLALLVIFLGAYFITHKDLVLKTKG